MTPPRGPARLIWLCRAAAVGFCVSGLTLCPHAASAEPLVVGTAKLDLIPPVKTPLAGYSRRKGRLATGVHDPPFVRVVAIHADDTTVALVSCDLLVIDERLFDAVKTRFQATEPHRPIHLLLAATHTHSGPGAYGQKWLEKISMGHFDPVVFEFLASRIAQAISTALAKMQPVTMSDAATMTTGLVTNRMRPDGVVDPELSVVAFLDAQRNPVAVVVDFSAHPTTLGAWNTLLSADYPGVLAQQIEQRYPTSVCLFLAGAVGDQGPVKQGEGFDRPTWLGTELATHVSVLVDQSHPEPVPSVFVEQRVVRLPPAHLRLGSVLLPSWFSQPFVDDDATLTVIAIGPVLLMGVPCDFSAELGLTLKSYAREKGFRPLVVGFANDYIGYCLPERWYRTQAYEAMLAFNGPRTGELLVETLKQMIDQLASDE